MLLPLGALASLTTLATALSIKTHPPARCAWRTEPELTRSGHIECGGLDSPCMGSDVRYLPKTDERGFAYRTCGTPIYPCPFVEEPLPEIAAVPSNPDTSTWPSCRLTSDYAQVWFNTNPRLGLTSRDAKKKPDFLDGAQIQAGEIERGLDTLDKDDMMSSDLLVDPLNELDPASLTKTLGQWNLQHGDAPSAELPGILSRTTGPADELEDKNSEQGDKHENEHEKRADLFSTVEVMGDNWRYDDQPGHPAVQHLPFVFDPAADGFGDKIVPNTPRPNGNGGL